MILLKALGMMDYSSFVFAAPPATGAEWFVGCCETAGLSCRMAGMYRTPSYLPSTTFYISIVRHPLSWLWGFFNLPIKQYSIPLVDIFFEDRRGCGGRFELFVESYLRRHPGGIGKMFDHYRATSRLRFEDFPWAVEELLESVDVSMTNHLKIKMLEAPSYVGGWMHNFEMRHDIVKAEKEFCLQMDYH